METDASQVQTYLQQLNTMTGGDPEAQVSMYEVGAALGLENDGASQMAETLLVDGQAELKTLSGGIGITAKGLEALGISPAVISGEDSLCLSRDKVVTDQDRKNVEIILDEIKTSLTSVHGEYPVLEGVVVDIKTIEVQMLSPSPKTEVIRAVIKSIQDAFPSKDFPELAARLSSMADT